MGPLKIDPSTYRFKLCPSLTERLHQFARDYSDVSRKDFQNAWQVFMEDNKELVNREGERLKTSGYRGCPIDKMYKSARYYFRGKTDGTSANAKQVRPSSQTKRNYTPVDKQLVKMMGEHIIAQSNSKDFTPASGFDHFCSTHTNEITVAVIGLVQSGVPSNEIPQRIKKAYKNRYFSLTRVK